MSAFGGKADIDKPLPYQSRFMSSRPSRRCVQEVRLISEPHPVPSLGEPLLATTRRRYPPSRRCRERITCIRGWTRPEPNSSFTRSAQAARKTVGPLLCVGGENRNCSLDMCESPIEAVKVFGMAREFLPLPRDAKRGLLVLSHAYCDVVASQDRPCQFLVNNVVFVTQFSSLLGLHGTNCRDQIAFAAQALLTFRGRRCAHLTLAYLTLDRSL